MRRPAPSSIRLIDDVLRVYVLRVREGGARGGVRVPGSRVRRKEWSREGGWLSSRQQDDAQYGGGAAEDGEGEVCGRQVEGFAEE
jgi:hypothetical protein